MEESGRNFIFSSGFKEKVIALQNLLTDANAEVRPFASGSLDLHWHHRVYGVAIKRSDLLHIVDMIRNNQGKYWIESTSNKKPESKTYSCLVNSPWEDYDGNQFKDASVIPEIKAIPNPLLSSVDLESRIAPGIDSWEERNRLLRGYLENYWDDILLKLNEHT